MCQAKFDTRQMRSKKLYFFLNALKGLSEFTFQITLYYGSQWDITQKNDQNTDFHL
jgi:hypothetical protein